MEETENQNQKKEKKKKRKKVDKSRLAIQIVAAILALVFVLSMFTTAMYYLLG